MRYIVLSDTHGDISAAKNVIDTLKEEVDGVIHLGDYEKDANYLKELYPALSFFFIKGNNEYISYAPEEKVISQEGWNIYMVHGHNHGVYYGFMRLLYAAEEKEADVVLFGHTHTPWCSREGSILMVNPGSISKPRGRSGKTFAVLEIKADKSPSAMIYEYIEEGIFEAKKI